MVCVNSAKCMEYESIRLLLTRHRPSIRKKSKEKEKNKIQVHLVILLHIVVVQRGKVAHRQGNLKWNALQILLK